MIFLKKLFLLIIPLLVCSIVLSSTIIYKNRNALSVDTRISNDLPVIIIDAGHGGDDPGAVGYNSSGKAVAYESHINLAIALLVGEKLEQSGFEVV